MEYTNPDLPEEAKMALTEIEKQFISMRSSGLPIRKIAKNLNKSTRTICLWNKKFYRNIVEINSNELKEFRNKIIKFKNAHLDFLIEEFQNVKVAMAKSGMLYTKKNWDYEGYLETIMKISKLVEKFESDLLISSDSIQKIDESQIIDADSEDIEILSAENIVSPDEQKNENNQPNSEENTVQKTPKNDENAGNTEGNANENIENIVVPEQNEDKINIAEHIDNM
jgi:hypothetical protein